MWINNVQMNIYVYVYDCLNSKYIYNVYGLMRLCTYLTLTGALKLLLLSLEHIVE